MRNVLVKKLLSIIVMTCLLFSSFGVAFGATASGPSDIKGHWAASNISAWIDKGLIKGYDDGSFKPDNQITRAEFIALINRSFGFTETADISFRDVSSDHWAHAEVAKAVKADYISGYADGTVGINKPISRQEVAVIVSRLLKLDATASKATFLDASQIASWSKDAINEVVASQIMNGYEADHSFKPEAPITRAEAVVTLDRAQAALTVSYQAAGTYGPETGVETINKNVVVNVAGVTLRNMVIHGDLLLAEGIGNGDAFLENVKVTGKVTVQGGGENSIHFDNSVLVDIIIDKKSGTGTVRIVSEGTTTIALVSVNSPAILKETNATGSGFGNVNISSSLPAGSKVTLAGSFNTVNVSSQQLQIDMPEGSIEKMNAKSTSTGMVLNLSDGAKINDLVLDAVIKMLGKGTIVLATMNIGSSTFETPPTKTNTTPTPTATPATGPITSTPTSTPGLTIDEAITAAKASLTADTIRNSNAALTVVITDLTLVTSGANGTTIAWSSDNTAVLSNTGVVTRPAFADGNSVVHLTATITKSGGTLQTKIFEVTVKAQDQAPDEAISKALTLLTADKIRHTNTALTLVITDLTLDTTGENGTSIAWSSDNTAVLANTGTVTRPAYTDGNSIVHLIATITKSGGTAQTKEFEVTVLKDTAGQDGRLLALHLSNVTFTESFSPDIYRYEATVPFNVTSTTITAITMNPGASIHLNYENDTKQLEVGSNEVQIYVNYANHSYYDIYSVQVYRLADNVEAQATAIATIEAYHGEDINLVEVLNTATGRNSAIAANVAFYREAIIAAGVGALDTADEIESMIEDVNYANEVPPADKTELNSAIAEATTLLSSHSIGSQVGEVSQEAHDAFHLAIGAASAIQDEPNATQDDVDDAISTLASATSAYQSAIIVVPIL